MGLGREPQRERRILEGEKGALAQKPDGTLVVSIKGQGLFTYFSPETTGDGTEQEFVHSLGRTPDNAFAIPSDLTGGPYTVVYGTHDSTKLRATVTNGEKYRMVALSFAPF